MVSSANAAELAKSKAAHNVIFFNNIISFLQLKDVVDGDTN
jgi:hypothetical protein